MREESKKTREKMWAEIKERDAYLANHDEQETSRYPPKRGWRLGRWLRWEKADEVASIPIYLHVFPSFEYAIFEYAIVDPMSITSWRRKYDMPYAPFSLETPVFF